MTTKRKQILKAMAFASCTTMDDLCLSTGLERKNLHDNVKASIREDLIERMRDDVTGLPAYKLTPKGRQWLENDKDNSSSVKPQPAVGQNTGSQDKGTRVASGDVCADPLPMGKAVTAPPKPDDLPAAAGADEIPVPDYDPREVSFNHLSREQALVERRASIDAALTKAFAENAALHQQISSLNALLDNANRINNEMANELLELLGTPAHYRYIIAEEYLLADSEEQAHEIALELAKNIEIDTPVIVFASHKARELRINWRDA